MATWIISNLDKNGVFHGDAVMVKSFIFPRRVDITIDQVDRYLQAMAEIGLIILFESDGQLWQFWPGFTDNQINLRADRESTEYPNPPDLEEGDNDSLPPSGGDDLPSPSLNGSGNLPEVIRQPAGSDPATIPPNLKESNLKESTTTTAHTREADPAKNLALISEHYQNQISVTFSSILSSEFKDYAVKCRDPAWITYAFKEAEINNVRNWAYVRKILDTCISNQCIKARPTPAENRPQKRQGRQPAVKARLSPEQIAKQREYAEAGI